MLRATATSLLIATTMSAIASPNDPRIAESNQVGSIARIRDEGGRMQDLLKASPPGKFLDAEEHEFHLRFMALPTAILSRRRTICRTPSTKPGQIAKPPSRSH